MWLAALDEAASEEVRFTIGLAAAEQDNTAIAAKSWLPLAQAGVAEAMFNLGVMGVDRYRVCELYAAGPDVKGSGSGYRLGDRLVLTARHVIAPAVAGAGGRVLVRPVGVAGWLPARVEWEDADADAALIEVEDADWRAPTGESVLRWGELAGSDPVPCAAVGFPWASAWPDRVRDTAPLYGQLAPLGQLRQGRLDLDVASASPSAREGELSWAGMWAPG